MKTVLMHALVVVTLLLVGVPATFIITFLLVPLWRWIESTYGIEAIGHSGPADWCFEVVYVLLVIAGLFGCLLVLKGGKQSRGETTGV
jgi:hypothetical protein